MKIFAFAGSLRAASFNRKLIALAAEAARKAGADVELGDFRGYCPPIYDGDVETGEGLPQQAKALAAKIEESDGLIIASPEYNRSIPGPLKNALDWVSRLKPYRLADKKVLMIGATSGKAGCANGFIALRVTLEFQTAQVFPESFGLNGGARAFTADGLLADGDQARKLEALVKAFVAS